MSENNFVSTVESLFHGMDNFIHAGLVVGEAVNIGDTIILPLADVSFGCAAGAFEKNHNDSGAGGLGGKVSPCAILVIQNGHTKLVNVKNQDSMTKILDMVPDIVDRFTAGREPSLDDMVDHVKSARKEKKNKNMSDTDDKKEE
ncbi:MAG: GerW family sporulation protein [Lachnospiraceae bacterium]|nr:GerW family sporulation protein [Lachnospiraceae bacterium]